MGKPAELLSRGVRPLQRPPRPQQQDPFAAKPPELTPEQLEGVRVQNALAARKVNDDLEAYAKWKAAKAKAQKEHDDAVWSQLRNRGLN